MPIAECSEDSPVGSHRRLDHVARGVAPAASAQEGQAASTPPPSAWYQYGYNHTHAGANPNETRLTRSTVANLRPGWTVADAGENPLVVGGRVLTVNWSDRHVTALASDTGRRLWRTVTGSCPAGPAAVHLQILVVPTSGCNSGASVGVATGYSVSSGAKLWTRRLDYAVLQGSAARDGIYYVSGFNYVNGDLVGSLTALDARTGAVRWVRKQPSRLGAVALSGDKLLLATEGALQARRLSDGAVVWSRAHGGRKTIATTGADTYVSSLSGDGHRQAQTLSRYNATGTLVWRVQLTGGVNFTDGQPSVSNGIVMVPSAAGTVAAYDAATGALRWTSAYLRSYTVPGISIAGGVAYVGTETAIIAYDLLTGRQLWSAATVYAGTPAIGEGRLYVPGDVNSVQAFRLPS